VFLSEILDNELSDQAQEIINEYVPKIEIRARVNLLDSENSDHNSDDDFSAAEGRALIDFQSPPIVKYSDYVKLDEESNYAAWTLIHGPIVNHEALAVHKLKGNNTLNTCVNLLDSNGIKIVRSASGVIKESEDGLLLQASSVADKIRIKFRNDKGSSEHIVPGSFVEYAERLVLPKHCNLPFGMHKEHHRRDGFETSNALQIFESTKKWKD
jgi:hypothetical protein